MPLVHVKARVVGLSVVSKPTPVIGQADALVVEAETSYGRCCVVIPEPLPFDLGRGSLPALGDDVTVSLDWVSR